MQNLQGASHLIRFGVFELDLEARELRNQGAKVRLQEQPFQLLTVLLEKPGRVVTREELQKRLWSHDTFVDFETGLNTAIMKIRDALGDSAESPGFIETLPRRGYRFIAPVERYPSQAGAQAESRSLEDVGRPQGSQRRVRRAIALAAAAVLVFVALAYVFRPSLPSPKVLQIVQITDDHRTKYFSMVTDGLRIYFSEIIEGHYRPMAVPATGGIPAPISTPFQDTLIFDISRDENELLVGEFTRWDEEIPLWALPTVGGTPRRLSDVTAYWAAWSPDGERMVYVKGRDLYLSRSDGSASRKVASPPGKPYAFRWSPDGKRISMPVGQPTTGAPWGSLPILWEMSGDGANLHPMRGVGGDGVITANGRWTPDGKYFVFDSNRGGPLGLWAMRVKGRLFSRLPHEPVELTPGPMDAESPLPSKDGRRVFFMGVQTSTELSRYDSRTGAWLPYLSGFPAEHLDFSKDGQWITYVSLPEANLFRSKADGSQRLQLTSPPLRIANPRWSPDGRRIAFMAQSPGSVWKIHLISADGGQAQQLMDAEGKEFDPGWSPDGNSLVFCHEPESPTQPPDAMPVRVIDLRTKRIRVLPGAGHRFYPRWSPNGRYIAATADGFKKLALFDFRTQKWTELARGDLYYPSWSRDGQHIYYINWSVEAQAFYRVNILDRKVERVAGLGDDVPTVRGTFGAWVGLAPNDSPLAPLSVGTNGEIYALDWEAP